VDSRRVRPGELFVALPGQRTDGHLHVAEAIANGAAGLLVTRELPPSRLAELRDASVVRVADGLRALHDLAAAWRTRFELPVVGVTGSVAKSSTKEAIATAVASRRRVLRSEGNENNEIGLPLTVLRLAPEHEAAVLEMGMYVPGDIAQLARIARPSIGVVTAVRPIHLSRAGSLAAIEKGKGELVEALPAHGVAVLNADDAAVRRMAERTAARAVTYGFDRSAEVRAISIATRGVDGMTFELVTPRGERPVELPRMGRHAVHNALAAAAIALELGLELDEVARALAIPWALPHRCEVLRADGIVIVDDTYNAGPDSMSAALETIAGLPGRHIAVLGEMAELGELAEEAHAAVGRQAAATLEQLVVVGDGARALTEAALAGGLDAGRVVHVGDAAAALREARARVEPGDVVLVKASRALELERVVEGLVEAFG
jgi:UDP-N-acetylmuramoyl-tripeptide--D-alanyl-D-alanine ligase